MASSSLDVSGSGSALRVGSSPRRLGLLTHGGGGAGQLRKSGCWRLWDGVRAVHFRVGPSEASDLEGREERGDKAEKTSA